MTLVANDFVDLIVVRDVYIVALMTLD